MWRVRVLYDRLVLFLGIVWRRVDFRCPNRLPWADAWDIAFSGPLHYYPPKRRR